jgi:hypothetical protein
MPSQVMRHNEPKELVQRWPKETYPNQETTPQGTIWGTGIMPAVLLLSHCAKAYPVVKVAPVTAGGRSDPWDT